MDLILRITCFCSQDIVFCATFNFFKKNKNRKHDGSIKNVELRSNRCAAMKKNLKTLCFFCFVLLLIYITYANKVRAACLMVPCNDGSKNSFGCQRGERSCLVLARSGMFGLDIAPKKKLSRLFNPVSIQE